MAEIPTSELIGARIGNYRILKKIASGGMAHLFLCCGTQDLSRRFAVKLLRPERIGDETARNRFLQEGELCAGMQHPGIVQIFDSGTEGQNCFIAMELIDGKNLEQLVKCGSVFSIATSLEIAWRIGDALRYAWQGFQLLHRDVKPSNIMIDANGNVKLLDFGIAKRLNADSAVKTLTGRSLGTPRFMSPEQFLGLKNIDFRSDIYSLGATLYYLLSKQFPFSTDDPAEIYRAITETGPKALEEIDPAIPPELSALVRRMMTQKPEHRFDSWDEVLDLLDQMIAGPVG